MTVLEALQDRRVVEDDSLVISKELAGAADRLYDCLDDVLTEVPDLDPGLKRRIKTRMAAYDLAMEGFNVVTFPRG